MSDLATLAAGLGEELRQAGVATSTEQAGRFARAVHDTAPLHLRDLYWTARVTLVTSKEEIPAFDAVFGRLFAGLGGAAELPNESASVTTRPPPAAPERRPRPGSRRPPTAGQTSFAPGPRSAEHDVGDEPELSVGLASREERLAQRDFARLDAEELLEIRRMLRDVRLALPLRPGRRSRRAPRGDRLDLRATLRRSHRSAGDPARLVRRSARPVPRRLVVICDISGSMEPYALAYVHFLHAAASASGAARAEVFTFATRLSRLTRVLAERDLETALRRAAAAAPDWRGGTRIGEALKSFLDSYGRRGVARGAVVVLMSDGWERDDPVLLSEQMARLRRLAHRIVWVNPRSADPRYEPLAGGMAAALPYCDDLVSGHSVAALQQLAVAVAAR